MIASLLLLLVGSGCCLGEVLMAKNRMKPEEIKTILKVHNDFRASVGASNMLKLKWSTELANLAEGFTQTCPYDHGNDRLPDGTKVGQNMAWGYASTLKNTSKGIQLWIDERRDYDFTRVECRGNGCLHLTQMLTAGTQWVGCAVQGFCEGEYPTVFVCNYRRGNNIRDTYARGKPCSKCPGAKCDGGLCSCDNPFCEQGGNVNLKTCSCNCQKPYTGPACNVKSCPEKDRPICGTQWPKSYCRRFGNVREDCPYMCDIC